MSEKDSKVGQLAEAAGVISNSGLAAGATRVLYLFVAFLPLMIYLVTKKWDGHLYDRQGCVQIQQVGELVFKVDTCTGDTEGLTAKSE